MKDYTKNNEKKQAYTQCYPEHRCNNTKKCKYCFNIWRKKQYKKATEHLKEKHIKGYKYKYLLTFVSLEDKGLRSKNNNLDNFLKELIRGKRYKSSFLYNAQYISKKHISHSKERGYNPHIHFLYLGNKHFKYSKQLKKIQNKYKIRIDCKIIKREKNSSYLTSVKKIINYMLKQEDSKIKAEFLYNITKNKRDLKKSCLFSKYKMNEKEKRLYKYIHLVQVEAKKKRAEVIKIFLRRKDMGIKMYIRMLKSLQKKLKRIEKIKKRDIDKIKRYIT